jgi:hypothetical protein
MPSLDDVTAASISVEPDNLALQNAADQLSSWCNENGMILNTKKTKEMLMYFGKKVSKDLVPQPIIHEENIKRVDTFKLLGVIISSDISWGPHVSYMLKKIFKRYYIIFQLAEME